jgi:Na+/proline symporter
MSEPDKTFRNRLLDVEKTDDAYKQRYERQVREMFEKKMNYPGRAGFAVLTIVGLLTALPFAELTFSNIGFGMGLIVRVVTIPALVLALTWAVMTGWIAARGRFNLKTLPPRMAGIGIALGFFGVVLFLFVFIVPVTLEDPADLRSTWNTVLGIQLSLIAFFFLVIVGLCLVLRLLYRIQFQTREKLLEIEYRLAQIDERFEGRAKK